MLIVKLTTFTTVYVCVLIFISPAIDHFFTTLDDDIHKEENNLEILLEIIAHIIVLSITWFFLHNFLRNKLENILGVQIKEATKSGIDLISAVVLVGLQKNLIEKLEYITITHPFRLGDFHLDTYLSSL